VKSLIFGAGLPMVAAALGTVAVLGSVGLIPGLPVWDPLYEAAVSARTVKRLPTATPTPLPTATPEPPTKAPTRVPPTPQPTATPRTTAPGQTAPAAKPAAATPTPARSTPPAAPIQNQSAPVAPPAQTTPIAGSTTRQAVAPPPKPATQPAPTNAAPDANQKPAASAGAKPAADPGPKGAALQLGDLAAGFVQAQADAPSASDAETFHVAYERGGLDAFVGTATIDNRAARYRSTDAAHAAFARFDPHLDTPQPTSVPNLGDETKAWTSKNADKTSVAYVVAVHKGAYVVTVSTGGTTSAGFDDALHYAQTVADRLP
jgi:hypothetical protein